MIIPPRNFFLILLFLVVCAAAQVMSLREVVRRWRVVCAFAGYRCVAIITHAQRALPRHSRHHCTRGAEASPTATSLAIAILIVNAYQRARECQYLSKRYQQRVVYLAHRRCHKSRHEHRASEDAQCQSSCQLQAFHAYWPSISARIKCQTY